MARLLQVVMRATTSPRDAAPRCASPQKGLACAAHPAFMILPNGAGRAASALHLRSAAAPRSVLSAAGVEARYAIEAAARTAMPISTPAKAIASDSRLSRFPAHQDTGYRS